MVGVLKISVVMETVAFLILTFAGSLHGVTSQSGVFCTMDRIEDVYIQNIPEDWPEGTVIRHLQINGDDSQISVYAKEMDPHVSFDPASRNLTLEYALDTEESSLLNIKLECEIISTSQKVTLDIKILLLDVNDNAPVFEQDVYTVNVSEIFPVNSPIITGITAIDADQDNWYIDYEIMQGDFSDYFTIPIPAHGDIVLAKPLDYEQTNTITIQIMALDNHPPVNGVDQPVLVSTASVVINVFDADDQNPVFIASPYSANVVENDPVGTVIVPSPSIVAVDQDIGINSPITYSIVPDTFQGHSEFVNMDPDTGEMTVAKVGLTRGMQLSFLIEATQVDNADRYGSALFHLFVTSPNENIPLFETSTYEAEIVENVPVGMSVITVTATDSDVSSQGTVLSYHFAPTPTVTDFQINIDTGLITTAKVLDYEKQTEYTLVVYASDGRNTATTTVIISVLDVNDNQPQFTSAVYNFQADLKNSNLVGKVQAIDVDTNSQITYSFLENSTLFNINNIGEVNYLGDESQVMQNTYKLVIFAKDGGTPQLSATTVANVAFDSSLVVVNQSTQEKEVDMILIIILGVISGILLVVIILLLVYIYRNNLQPLKNHQLRPQNFERQFNPAAGKDIQRPTYTDEAKALAYKKNSAHSLALYEGIDIDTDSTAPQDSPFIPDDTYSGMISSMDINENRTLPPQHVPNDTLRRQMRHVHEIDYETAVAPVDNHEYENCSGGSSESFQSSEPPSVEQVPSGGSTQNLVTPKGTVRGTLRKKPGVSFISEAGMEQPEYYSKQIPTLNPEVTIVRPEEKPGITLYY